MRVVCIEDRFTQVNHPDIKAPNPVVGEKYTVMNVIELDRYTLYLLAEFGPRFGYDSKGFALESDIDETTFERNYKKELV